MPNRGHSLTIDHGWQEVAQTTLDFVKRFVPAKRAKGSEQAALACSRDRLTSARDFELAPDVLRVRLERVHGDEQPPGDLPIGEVVREQVEHAELGLCQPVGRCPVARPASRGAKSARKLTVESRDPRKFRHSERGTCRGHGVAGGLAVALANAQGSPSPGTRSGQDLGSHGTVVSANKLIPLSAYPDELVRTAARQVTTAQVVHFDGSDLLPGSRCPRTSDGP